MFAWTVSVINESVEKAVNISNSQSLDADGLQPYLWLPESLQKNGLNYQFTLILYSIQQYSYANNLLWHFISFWNAAGKMLPYTIAGGNPLVAAACTAMAHTKDMKFANMYRL
jgi:hypothetical protein